MNQRTRGFSFLTLALIVILMVLGAPMITAQDDTTLIAMPVASASTDPLDASWDAVPALSVPLTAEFEDPIVRSGVVYDPIAEVALQAVYTEDMIYVRAVWPDTTRNDDRGQWTYTESGWVKNSNNEDRLAFMFDITGNAQYNALGCGATCHSADGDVPAFMGFPADSTDAVDVWHWKGTRTVGYSDDQWAGAVVLDAEEVTGRANDAKDSGGYADNVNEAGDGPRFTFAEGVNPLGPLFASDALEITSDMTFEIGQTIPFYVQDRPVGSRGDISTSARHISAEDGSGWWYVVLGRPLNTGNPDDALFVPGSNNVFGVAVFNNSGDHSASEDKLVLTLSQ